jgi:hypothetical protein
MRPKMGTGYPLHELSMPHAFHRDFHHLEDPTIHKGQHPVQTTIVCRNVVVYMQDLRISSDEL